MSQEGSAEDSVAEKIDTEEILYFYYGPLQGGFGTSRSIDKKTLK